MHFRVIAALLGLGTAVAASMFATSAFAKDILIRNVTVFDGTGAPAIPNANVLVKGNKIAAISREPINNRGATVIDGTGKFLTPGLIDTHIHLPGGQSGTVADGERKLVIDKPTGTKALHGFIYSGVTSVYDSGNYTDFIFAMRADERAGKVVSPRIFAGGGTVTVPGGYASGSSAIKAANWEQTKAELDKRFTYKPDLLKLILDRQGIFFNKPVPTMSADLFKQIVDYGHANGVRSTVHISAEWDAETALDAGVDALAHPVMRSLANDVFIKKAADKKIPISTTITVFNNIARVADDPAFFDEPLFVAVMDSEEREKGKTSERARYISSGMSPMFKLMMPYALNNINRLYKAGAVLALGTDRAFGPAAHQELEYLVKAGVSPFDCIKIATLNAAIYLAKEKELGSVEVGKLADLLLLDADPSQDVRNFRAINTVIKDGKRIDRSKLDLPVNHAKK